MRASLTSTIQHRVTIRLLNQNIPFFVQTRQFLVHATRPSVTRHKEAELFGALSTSFPGLAGLGHDRLGIWNEWSIECRCRPHIRVVSNNNNNNNKH